MKKKVYFLDYKIKFKIFKKLQKRLVNDSGPVPSHADKAIWNLLKEKRIYCWFATDMPGDMGIGSKIPRRYKKYKQFILESKN